MDNRGQTQEEWKEEKKKKDMAYMPTILKELREGGFEDAAVFLERKI